jgi:2-polyprenyl-3-methyl-5-hydroxy-6-metoxy-1,4-benzoquinol methylase
MKCPICKNEDVEKKHTLYDDRYGYLGSFHLFLCKKCNHKYLNLELSPETVTNLYTNYYPRSTFNIKTFKPSKQVKGFNSWFNGDFRAYAAIPENVRVLDIGCGFGETLAYHSNRGCEVYGVEADENIKRVAEKFGFKVHVGLFDASIYTPDFFDYVTMDQVIEHINNPLEILHDISSILKPGGKLILTIPNANGWGSFIFGRKWINWHTPYHLHFFSKQSIKFAANNSNLNLEKIRTVTTSQWLHYQWIHLFYFPKRGVPSLFWKPDQTMTYYNKVILKILEVIHISKINHLITRLFDWLGIGDCTVIYLSKPI